MIMVWPSTEKWMVEYRNMKLPGEALYLDPSPLHRGPNLVVVVKGEMMGWSQGHSFPLAHGKGSRLFLEKDKTQPDDTK
jgi:hypothetical protein